jgi:hypothetical protein
VLLLQQKGWFIRIAARTPFGRKQLLDDAQVAIILRLTPKLPGPPEKRKFLLRSIAASLVLPT